MTDTDLVSVRGLVDSDFESPLRKFDGVFEDFKKLPASGYEGWRVDLNFKEVDNVVAISPYNFPIVVLNFPLSNKNKTRWGYFSNSITALTPPNEDLKDWKGRRMTLVYCDGQDGRPAPKPIWNRDANPEEFPGKIVPTPVWIVTEVEGGVVTSGGGVSAAEWAEENLVGKTRAEFNKWAFADPKVRKDTAFQRNISDRSFINSLLQLSRIVEDENGVFQKAE